MRIIIISILVSGSIFAQGFLHNMDGEVVDGTENLFYYEDLALVVGLSQRGICCIIKLGLRGLNLQQI